MAVGGQRQAGALVRGEAAGVKEGGIVEQPIHEVEVECPASAIPEKIIVKIADLGLNKSITIGDIALPDQVRILDDADLVVVTCHVPAAASEDTGVEGTGAEPEVIGRAAKEEGEESEK